MNITKAVITAASRQQRHLPLQTLVDTDGNSKSALAIILEEIECAGIEEIAVVVSPGDAAAYAAASGVGGRRLTFIEQPNRSATLMPSGGRGILLPGNRFCFWWATTCT